ncbi:NACHT domain-containing protein [Thermococcus barophilus]|nr:NACHT domain-containing protein [Thermococcus barophilus]
MKKHKLSSYLNLMLNNLTKTQVPGILGLTVGDILKDEVFVDLPWKFLNKKEIRHDSLVLVIIDGMTMKNKSYLVLSNPGQGKSILLKKIFSKVKDQYKKNREFIPLFIEIRKISSFFEKHNNGKSFKTLLWKYLTEEEIPKFPLSYKEFENRINKGKIIFILDGLDEAPPSLLTSLNKDIEALGHCPLLISCRKNEYQLYVKNSELDQITEKIEILPMDYEKIETFVSNYIKYLYNLPEKNTMDKKINEPAGIISDFMDMLKNDKAILELAKYPLLLSMTIHLYLSEPQRLKHWNIYQLYFHYVTNIIAYETNKKQKHAKLDIDTKQKILTDLAGFLFKQNRTYFTIDELKEITNRFGVDVSLKDVKYNICNHSLIRSQGEHEYSFIHTSFQDYYTAKYIVKVLEYEKIKEGTEILKIHISSDIERFLKYMLKSLQKNAIEKVALSLKTIYNKIDLESINNNPKTKREISEIIMGKQQTAHYLAILIPYLSEDIKEDIENFLIGKLRTETNKFITRGIRVGLFRHANRKDILKEYLRLLEKDWEEREVNCGYYLMYYGDQVRSYIDLGKKDCENTVRNIIRHFLSINHKAGWPLDLITFRQCILQNEERRRLVISKGYLLEALYAIQKNLLEYMDDELTYNQLVKFINFLISLKDELEPETLSKIEDIKREIEKWRSKNGQVY